jgi:hypothetical protein
VHKNGIVQKINADLPCEVVQIIQCTFPGTGHSLGEGQSLKLHFCTTSVTSYGNPDKKKRTYIYG